MATSLPPLPTDSNSTGPNPSTPAMQEAPPQQSSAFAGGLPGMVQAITQIERGYKMLAGMLPSLAPIAADAISKLRTAIPNAIGAGAGAAQPPDQSAGPSGSQGQLPPPPPQGAQ